MTNLGTLTAKAEVRGRQMEQDISEKEKYMRQIRENLLNYANKTVFVMKKLLRKMLNVKRKTDLNGRLKTK